MECKTVLLGQVGTGKSALVERFLNDNFHENPPPATVGASYAAKRIETEQGEVVVSLWDTAGAERFDSLSKLYYRGAEAALICVDLANAASFTKSQYWVNQLKENQPACRCYIVLTKCDLLEIEPSQLPPLSSRVLPIPTESCAEKPENLVREEPQNVDSQFCSDHNEGSDSGSPNNIDSPNLNALRRQTSTPTNVLDRHSSSFGSNWSRSTGSPAPRSSSTKRILKKQVSDTQLKCMAITVNAKLLYTSSHTGQGVRELFQMVAEDLAEQKSQNETFEHPNFARNDERRGEGISHRVSLEGRPNNVVLLEKPESCFRATKNACCS